MEIAITGPQIERTDGKVVPEALTSAGGDFLDWLQKQDDSTLRTFGLLLWDDGHWLYPGEWFGSIPEGYSVVDIFDKAQPFSKATSSDDIRFGCLAYGFKR